MLSPRPLDRCILPPCLLEVQITAIYIHQADTPRLICSLGRYLPPYLLIRYINLAVMVAPQMIHLAVMFARSTHYRHICSTVGTSCAAMFAPEVNKFCRHVYSSGRYTLFPCLPGVHLAAMFALLPVYGCTYIVLPQYLWEK